MFSSKVLIRYMRGGGETAFTREQAEIVTEFPDVFSKKPCRQLPTKLASFFDSWTAKRGVTTFHGLHRLVKASRDFIHHPIKWSGVNFLAYPFLFFPFEPVGLLLLGYTGLLCWCFISHVRPFVWAGAFPINPIY